MGDMRDIEFGAEEIKQMKQSLTTWLKEEISQGKECIRPCDIDTLSNAIHHLAETERNCYEALYYKTVVEQMENAEESLRMGAPRSRDSMGRYTSNRGGNMRGGYSYPYEQGDYIDAYIHDPNQFIDDMMPMGYRPGSTNNRNRIGNEYNQYRMAKRHYTENGDSKSKSEMNTHAMKHFKESVGTFKDIWEDADPSLKMEMKKDLQNLIADMPVD